LIQPNSTRRISETIAEISSELAQPMRLENMKNKAHLREFGRRA
jgi:hypothetical protein